MSDSPAAKKRNVTLRELACICEAALRRTDSLLQEASSSPNPLERKRIHLYEEINDKIFSAKSLADQTLRGST